MIEITREEKIEKILAWWLEGWQDLHHDISILTDELMGLHTGNKPLWQFDDEELNLAYEEVIEQQKDLGYE